MTLHSYSVNDATNRDEHVSVAYKLAGLSALLGSLFTYILGLIAEWGVVVTLGAPSTVVIYLLLVRYFDRYLWSTSVGKWLGVTTPNLNGRWSGTVTFKRQDGSKAENDTVEVKIEQNWRSIGVAFCTDKTESESDSASILIGANQATLIYRYRAEKRRPEHHDFPEHSGTGVLKLVETNGIYHVRELEIRYYSNHGETGSVILGSA